MHAILTTTTKGDEEEEEEEEPSSYTDHEEEQEQPSLLHRTDDSSSACPRTKPDSPFSWLDLLHPPAQSSQHHLPSLLPQASKIRSLFKSVLFLLFPSSSSSRLLSATEGFSSSSFCFSSFSPPAPTRSSFPSCSPSLLLLHLSSKFAHFHQTKFIPPLCPVSRIPQPYKKLLLLLLLLFPHMKFHSIKSQEQQREFFLPKSSAENSPFAIATTNKQLSNRHSSLSSAAELCLLNK